MNASPATTATPPSRDANPFATCWTRPGALPWRGDIDAVVERLHRCEWRGQVVGPHGSGKSTLILSLIEPLREAGKRPVIVDVLKDDDPQGDTLLVEAFERLPRREQRRRLAQWRESGLGYVVTTHRPLRSWLAPLPVVADAAPDESVVAALYGQLIERRSTPVTLGDALASFASHDGDLRETWFDLYSLHESRRRRTLPPVVAYSELKPAPQDRGATLL